MPTITQKHRIFAVGTSLGEDVLVFGRMTATEQLGRLFEFDLELLSERTDIALSEVLGKNMTVRMELPEARGGGTRYFNGFVTLTSMASSPASVIWECAGCAMDSTGRRSVRGCGF